MTAPDSAARSPSKTIATWIALVGGSLGLHRFYLHGARDGLAWLHMPPTIAGAFGAWRMRELGTDDRLGNLLVPLLGSTLAIAMLAAIVCGLASPERWRERFGASADGRSNPLTVLGVVAALAIGATVTMATIAFVAQRYFEWRAAG